MTRDGVDDGEGSGPEGAGPLAASGERPTLPSELLRFVHLFREGRYWDSHEVLEHPWRARDSRFYHGLILVASAWVHVERENAHGIDAQLRKALDALDGFPDAYLGLDVEALREAARSGRRAVAEHRDDPPLTWGEIIPPPSLPFDPARIRGDEDELRSGPDATG